MRRHRPLARKGGRWLLVLCLFLMKGFAAESADYTIRTDGMVSGGLSTGGLVRCVAGLGEISGVSTSALTDAARHGFIAQLYEVEALAVCANPNPVAELSSAQANAVAELDDGSILVVASADPQWSVSGWPLATIDAAGTVTAGAVYANTCGVITAVYDGVTGTSGLTVLDVDPDNFGSYAGDGVDDDWQVKHFGLDNTNALAGMDPDSDKQSNELEFYAMTDPWSSTSALAFWIEPVPAATNRCALLFHPCHTQRIYTVQSCTQLAGTQSWCAIIGTIQDAGWVRRVTDTNVVKSCKYYRLRISKP